ncbi:hypothetical protein GWE18_08665 [Bradyrhizobium sp. CSA112]|uniref:hypothetical protein n=1 Tax=Bradyrhizobium sp. CSA112 TaxID=2699170 RepID=UPI0023B02889|nr:hypothetical protein [Bradyrhizobium sp. CSA112]MDE5452930.1 hypothetical protein [Bradyrhizobium sp. CSA112]
MVQGSTPSASAWILLSGIACLRTSTGFDRSTGIHLRDRAACSRVPTCRDSRVERIASLLFALFFVYFLKSTILGYATEPKVLGGIDFDQPIPQVAPWTPIYFPLLLSAAFGYWI